MQLSRFLGLRVVDAGGHPVGTVVDVRLTISGDLQHNPSTPRVLGLIVSPRTKSSFLGYERSTGHRADDAGSAIALSTPRHIPRRRGRTSHGSRTDPVILRPAIHQVFGRIAD